MKEEMKKVIDKIRLGGSVVVSVIIVITFVLVATGKLNGVIAKLSGEIPMLRGNDTGATIGDNRKVVVKDDNGNVLYEEPYGESSNNVETETYTAEDVVPPASESGDANLSDVFAVTESEEEEPWWSKDRFYCWVNSSTGDEVDVRVHWAAEDIGEVNFTFSDGSTSGVSVFETDGMWNYFTLDGEEACFYIDDSVTPEEFHLFRGANQEEELIFVDLNWMMENAG